MLKGVPVSPGIAVARAYCLDEVLARREPQKLDVAVLSDEVRRFETALQEAGAELDQVVARVHQQVGKDEAAIFRSHRQMLRDPALIAKVKSTILQRQVDASAALHEVLDEYTGIFSKIEDEFFRERLSDLRDVVARILAKLTKDEINKICSFQAQENVVIVAHELLPSQSINLKKLNIAGILTEVGGTTGHAAILSRSLGIPSVAGVRGALRHIKTGDLIVFDGRDGHIHINPDAEIESAYRKKQREYVNLRDRLIENREQEAVTKDGLAVELLANVNGPADAEMAVRTGACGVGLYRTEYLFLTHPNIPDEEEQLAAYRAVIEASPNRKVTIRTLDIGGDKLLPYFGHEREANPFMGYRSIRLSTAYPEFFNAQLRAILRSGLYGQVSILFPMISRLEEVRQIKRQLEKTKAKLREDGIAFQENMPLGAMLEVPAAALCVDRILGEVDFVSIGSNDLVQYVMAADRDNPKVSHLCDPFSPPILRLLRHVLRACQKHHKPATLCGEMAGRPRCFLPLLGMGLLRLSMSPAFVPSMKEMVRSSDLSLARRVARKALRLSTFQGIQKYLTRITRATCPDVAFFDVAK